MMDIDNEIWRQILLPEKTTIDDIIKNLEKSSLKIVLIVDGAGALIGTVCDGDVRRGLLKGLNVDSNISAIINRDSLVVPLDMKRDLVKRLMTANKIQQIPVVDDDQIVVGLHLWDEVVLQKARDNMMVIMAGGKGMRLRPQTENCPKPMLPVMGKPMLEQIIISAKLEGFTHFILAVNYLGHMIEDHFGNGQNFDVRIEYLREESPLGTAGALHLLDPLPEAPFIVTNGDVMTDIRYGGILDFHARHKGMATMAVRSYELQHPFGVVKTQGVNVVGFEEKPLYRSYINAGIYVLEPKAINVLSGDRCDMPDLFTRLQRENEKTIAYPMHEPWLDLGGPADFDLANSKSK